MITLIAVVASGAWLVTQEGFGLGDRDSDGSMMGRSSDSGPVEGLTGARDRVEEFAEAVGGDLGVGKVMRFAKNYSSGGGAQIRQDTGLEWVTPHTQQLGHTTPAITRAVYVSKPAIAADVAHVLQELSDPSASDDDGSTSGISGE